MNSLFGAREPVGSGLFPLRAAAWPGAAIRPPERGLTTSPVVVSNGKLVARRISTIMEAECLHI